MKMNFRKLVQNGCFVSLLVPFMISQVHATLLPSNCPSMTSVQNAAFKIDRTFKQSDGYYYVGSSKAVIFENQSGWVIGVGQITANSEQDALKIGRIHAQNITQFVKKTKLSDKLLICEYGPQAVVAVNGEFLNAALAF